MIVKQVVFGNEAREKLFNGVRILSRAVKSTLGARGRTVLIESENHTRGLTSTKDGVTVANSINLEDPIESMAVQTLREAAVNTAKEAGDGTTTSIVLAEAIINSASVVMQDTKLYNRTLVLRHMVSYVNEICKKLDQKSIKVSGKRLYDVATVSANNDKDLGKVIGDAYKYVGKNGVVTVKDGTDEKTTLTTSNGIKFDRGQSSPYQWTDRKRKRVEMDGGVFVLVSDRKLESLHQIEGVLASVLAQNKSILLICELDYEAEASLNHNVSKGKLKATQVIPPNFGRRKTEMLEDIANVIGANYISDRTGSDWGLVTIGDLGYVDSVLVDENSTTMFSNEIFSSTEFSEYISSLEEDMKNEQDQDGADDFRNRIAMLSGKTATILVGGKTDLEQKERKDRVDDAVLATKAALDSGVLPGGGLSLYRLSMGGIGHIEDSSQDLAVAIINTAIKEPFKQILRNADIDSDDVEETIEAQPFGYGYDVKNEEYCDMIKKGIIDPTKVTKTALLNAVSVAVTILSCDTVISNVRDYGK
jgi:chaperonin GroEL